MRSNCTRVNIETTLFTEGSIASDDRFSELKSGHELCTQLTQHGVKLLRRGGYVRVMVNALRHAESMPFSMSKGNKWDAQALGTAILSR
ncbi:Hypothetical protein NGAL_HAMBI1146_07850 [Neorhizobium galegae bv. officinalis]|nr:Hypothetical protein NGAL_HAMBI490_47770 [Neorhizobium galegae bv. officinalis]CDZ34285.1 Hypothetical protein NGAL_HAMBI1146_07850 [Neorhizobium galegae bv. officinalis]